MMPNPTFCFFVLLNLLSLLSLTFAITATRIPLIASTLPQNITSLRNFTSSLSYATSAPPESTLVTGLTSIPQDSTISTWILQESISSTLSAPLLSQTQPISNSAHSSPTSTSQTLPTSTLHTVASIAPSLPPPPAPMKPCKAICPGKGKVCGTRMTGDDCNADTLYSCVNNWDPPLEGEGKDCSDGGKKGVCNVVKQGFWDRFTGTVKDGCGGG